MLQVELTSVRSTPTKFFPNARSQTPGPSMRAAWDGLFTGAWAALLDRVSLRHSRQRSGVEWSEVERSGVECFSGTIELWLVISWRTVSSSCLGCRSGTPVGACASYPHRSAAVVHTARKGALRQGRTGLLSCAEWSRTRVLCCTPLWARAASLAALSSRLGMVIRQWQPLWLQSWGRTFSNPHTFARKCGHPHALLTREVCAQAAWDEHARTSPQWLATLQIVGQLRHWFSRPCFACVPSCVCAFVLRVCISFGVYKWCQ